MSRKKKNQPWSSNTKVHSLSQFLDKLAQKDKEFAETKQKYEKIMKHKQDKINQGKSEIDKFQKRKLFL